MGAARFNMINSNPKTIRPCCLCAYKEYDVIHYTLNDQFGVKKLSSPELISIIDTTRTCPTCGCIHPIAYQCKTVSNEGRFQICPKGCKHNGYPLYHASCKHSDEAPSYTISKVGYDKSIPLVENIYFGSTSIGIQYETGCQLSLISRSGLQPLPADMYCIEKPTRIGILAYAGDEETSSLQRSNCN